jgi:MoxR-like ATPase
MPSNPFTQLRTDLISRFPERTNVIDGALAAVLAGEHVLLLGPPGTAKSALARAIAQAFSGIYFERLLTRFSTPEELFGAISLKALEQDRFARVVTGKLPEADFAFVDEIFKANSAILNSLLAIINERVFHNDGQPLSCPLVTMFGASNELPESKDLEALFDRFLLRFDVGYLLRPANLRIVLADRQPGHVHGGPPQGPGGSLRGQNHRRNHRRPYRDPRRLQGRGHHRQRPPLEEGPESRPGSGVHGR